MSYKYMDLDAIKRNDSGRFIFAGDTDVLLKKIEEHERKGWELVTIELTTRTAVMRKPN